MSLRALLQKARLRGFFVVRGGSMRGFTLVEMAVVVTIIGVLLAMGLAAANSLLVSTQRSNTKDRETFVRDVLIGYFTLNHRFPCPDTGNGASTARDGVEDRATPGNVTTACAAGAGSVGIGTVPYATLGISRDQALDAYGNFITYRLDTARNWHLSSTFPASPAACNPPGILAAPVTGLSVYSDATTLQTSVAAVVLISHGFNGQGAWNQSAVAPSRNVLPTSPSESGNTVLTPAGPAGYRAYAYSDSAAAPFDDIVSHMGVADLQAAIVKMGRANLCN